VDKYTWVDLGSSYLPSELVAAFLWAQMEEADVITRRRLDIWDIYHAHFELLEEQGKVRRPIVPSDCAHNAHMYYLVLPSLDKRTAFIDALRQKGIGTVFHYVPLDSSPMGEKYCRRSGTLTQTQLLSDRLVRLPLWLGLEEYQSEVIGQVIAELGKKAWVRFNIAHKQTRAEKH
jgi:dTDP-4-amino-4,6-dideoxygalactose transaminase